MTEQQPSPCHATAEWNWVGRQVLLGFGAWHECTGWHDVMHLSSCAYEPCGIATILCLFRYGLRPSAFPKEWKTRTSQVDLKFVGC